MTAEGVRYLRICCSVNGLIYAAMYVFDSFAIGSGASWVAMCNAMLDAALLRLPLCWLLAFPSPWAPPAFTWARRSPPSCPALAGLCYFRLRCRRVLTAPPPAATIELKGALTMDIQGLQKLTLLDWPAGGLHDFPGGL